MRGKEHLRHRDHCDLKQRGSAGALEEMRWVREVMEEGSRSVLSSRNIMRATYLILQSINR